MNWNSWLRYCDLKSMKSAAVLRKLGNGMYILFLAHVIFVMLRMWRSYLFHGEGHISRLRHSSWINIVQGWCEYTYYCIHRYSWPYLQLKKQTILKYYNWTLTIFHHHCNKHPEQIGRNAPLKRLTFLPLAPLLSGVFLTDISWYGASSLNNWMNR